MIRSLNPYFRSETSEGGALAESESLNSVISEQEHLEETIDEVVDYSGYGKEELLSTLVKGGEDSNSSQSYRVARKVKEYFDHIVEAEKADSYSKFIADGGLEDSFEYRPEGIEKEFEKVFKQIRDRHTKHITDQNGLRESNFVKKTQLLDSLRELVNAEETNNSIKKLKELQDEWKKATPVAPEHNQILWANYNALLDRFYDRRSIFFELKELDRKKNLEAKKDICDKAEKLVTEPSVSKALKELNELHQEYKNIGPVPQDVQEELWARFKLASDSIYERRKHYLAEVSIKETEAFDKKMAIILDVEASCNFDSDRIDAWNKRAEEVLKTRDDWTKLGFVPKEKAKEVNRRFWAAFKQFFTNKKEFFKKIDSKRDANLELKVNLCLQVEELLDSTSADAVDQVKNIQRKWKEVGPVPNKKGDAVFERFKQACDGFFDKRRELQNVQDVEYKENLKTKIAICERLEKPTGEPISLKEIKQQWDAIGFVPRNEMQTIKTRFLNAISSFIDTSITEETDRNREKLVFQLSAIKDSPDAKIKLAKKEQGIKNKIREIEDNIANMGNNMEFFARSKNADSVRAEFNTKILAAKEELNALKQQLKVIRNF